MKGFIRFKATESQLKDLSEFIKVRKDFEDNYKNYITEKVVINWKVFKHCTYEYTTPPEGLFWFDWGRSESDGEVYSKKWYRDFLSIYAIIQTGEEVSLDQEAYKNLIKVLEML